ncbi:MAG: tetratricopeptide repeat protein [Lewinellaceae bacterium]|nr:tetratricopeptide repeat protein [Lewinellaceae bacterium]
MKPWSFTILFVLFTGLLSAQNGLLRKAEKKMEALDFQAAISLLENGLRNPPPPAGAALLGECYRRAGRFGEAETWFQKVSDWSEVRPQWMLNYARTLQRNARYPEAVTFYERYLGRVRNDQLAAEQLASCQQIRTLQERGLGWWEVQGLPFNSEYREFCPVFHENTLVFCSDRPVEGLSNYQDAWTGEGFLDLFKVTRKVLDSTLCASYSYSSPALFNNAMTTRFHEASAHFSADGEEIYFTSNAPGSGKGRDDAGLLRLQILHARRLPGHRGWTDPLPISINSEEYSVMHPCLSADARRLFFASDMPGGYGGLDLYYVEMIQGVWGPPINLGPSVNTTGNEVFPYFAPDGAFYFSSDGWGGLGGLDIFSTRLDREGRPFNPGFPLNSPADDFGFIWEEVQQCGYFSSDRNGGAGKDDLYVFRRISHPVHVEIVDSQTGVFIGGGILTSDCRQDTLSVLDGQARWEVPHNTCCELRASAPGYHPGFARRCTYNLPSGEPIHLALSLDPQPVFSLEGVVFQYSTGLPLEETSIQVIDKENGRVVASFSTDFSGRIELLLEEGVCYQFRVTKNGYAPLTGDGPCVPFHGQSENFRYKFYLRTAGERGGSYLEGGKQN